MLAPLSVEVGMLYSEPDVRAALRRLRDSWRPAPPGPAALPAVLRRDDGCGTRPHRRASCAAGAALPDVHFVADYHDHPPYIDALRASVAAHWQARGRTGHLLMSFHGIPERYCQQGDPYFRSAARRPRVCWPMSSCCARANGASASSRASARRSGCSPTRARCWPRMPARGVREVTVVCPGFAVDCLETLEEIEI